MRLHARSVSGSRPQRRVRGRTRFRRLVPALAVVAALVVGILAASLFRGEATPSGGGGATSDSPASPSPTVPPTFRTVERALSDPEEQLLAYVPDDVSSECLPLDRDAPIHGERASLVCRTADLEVLYELFQTRDEMNAAFEVNANNKQAPDGECATDHLAVTPYSIGGDRAGRVLCYTVERGTFSSALAGSVPHRVDRRERLDLRARDPERPRRPQPVRVVADVIGPGPPADRHGPRSRRTGPRCAPCPASGRHLSRPPGRCAGSPMGRAFSTSRGSTYGSFTELDGGPFDEVRPCFSRSRRPSSSPARGPASAFESIRAVRSSIRPATYRGPGPGARFRSRGRREVDCVGPGVHQTPTWTLAPDGLIALEEGGQIELVSPGGEIVRSRPPRPTPTRTVGPTGRPTVRGSSSPARVKRVSTSM